MSFPMSYAGSGQPAPTLNSPAGYVWFKAMLDYIFAQHNGTDALASGATLLWTPGTDSALGLLVRRSKASEDSVGGGGVQLGWATLRPNSATVAGLTHRRFSSGTTSSPVVLYAEDGSTILAQWLYEGSIVASGGQFKNALTQTFAAAQAGVIGLSQTFDASQSANLLQGVVGSTGMYAISPQGDLTIKRFIFAGGKTIVGTGGLLQLLAIGGLDASATGTDMVHHIAAGWYLNSAGLTVPYLGGTLTLASTGANQYVGVYLDDGGAAHLTASFPTSAVQFPTSAAKPLYVDFVPASATQFVAALSGSAGQAVIAADLRFLSGGSGGGGGGMAANAPTITVGDYTGTNANSRSIAAVLSGTASGTTGGVTFGATNQGTNLIAGTQGGNAFLSDALYQSVSPNVINALAASGASLQLTATGGPIFLATSNSVGGVTTNRMGVISTTTTTSGTATGAGLYKLVARLPASGPPTLYLTQAGISTYDVALCTVYWDGSAWQFGSAPNNGLVDWSPVVQPVSGAMLQPTIILGVSAGTGTTVNAASYTSAALVASGTLTTAVVTPTVTMRGMVWISCYVSMGSPVATGNALLGVMVNGSFVGQAHFVTDMTASVSGTRSFFAPVTLNAGTQYTIGLGAQVTANSYTVNFAQMMGWLFR